MDDFEQRLRALTADGDIAALPVEAWRAAVRAAVAQASPDDVCDMARTAHRRPAPGWAEAFRTRLAEEAGQSPPDASRLLAVLAGTALSAAFDDRSRGPLALYCSVGASHAGLFPADAAVRVDGARLRAAGDAARRAAPSKAPKITLTTGSYEPKIPAGGTVVTGDDLRAALAAVAEGVTDALSRGHAAVVRAAEKREAILHEQVGVLRWLISGHSSAAQAPWADLPPAQAAVAAAIELDRLTRFRVGVPDAEPLLAQTVALADAAPADPDADRGLAGQLPDPGPLADLAPLLAAAREGTAAPSSASPADLAFGLYSELRLVRAYRAAW